MVNYTNLSNKRHFSTKAQACRVWQKASVKLFWVASLVTINIFSQPVEANETKVENHVDAADKIVCLSASGNGYNWAATLTWAAEIVRDAVNQAVDNIALMKSDIINRKKITILIIDNCGVF